MADIHIEYKPVPWAEKFHASRAKHCCLVGGLGSAKTTSALWDLLLLALENPGFTYLVARKTMPSLRDTTMKSFYQMIPTGLKKEENKTHSIYTIMGDSDFIFRPLDDPEKLKSLEIAGFFVDEANEIDKNTYDILKSRVRQKVKGKEPTMYRTIISLNPTEEDHWIPTLFIHNKPQDSELFTSTTMDNPHLPIGYIDELKRTFSQDMQQRMIFGLFGKVHKGRPVYPQFSRGNYVRAMEIDKSKPLIRGWDFGYNHPAVVWCQMHNRQIRVLAEMMGKGIYLQDFVRDEVLPYQATLFGDWTTKIIDFCDPRGSDETDKGKTSVKILNEHGIWPAYRRTWIEEGIKAVKECLDTIEPESKDPNLLVHPRCKVLVEGFRGGYAREDGEEKPKKDDYYDHLQDAFRYLTIHTLQRQKIAHLMNNSQPSRVYISPQTGRRVEF